MSLDAVVSGGPGLIGENLVDSLLASPTERSRLVGCRDPKPMEGPVDSVDAMCGRAHLSKLLFGEDPSRSGSRRAACVGVSVIRLSRSQGLWGSVAGALVLPLEDLRSQHRGWGLGV
jgi:hypothetical protein